MNYHHHFHAGNFADVFKHALLLALFAHFKQKESPFCYLDTHAGSGAYDLTEDKAQRSQEHQGGIQRLLAASCRHPILRAYQAECAQHPNLYLGSPLWARACLRAQDGIIFVESEAEVVGELKEHNRRIRSLLASSGSLNPAYTAGNDSPRVEYPSIAIHQRDGYEALGALLPPKIRRGLVLIDPPFEKIDEFETITQALINAQKRWPEGVYAVWYPIKNAAQVKKFIDDLREIGRPMGIAEFWLNQKEDAVKGLQACGLAILNLPWQFEETAKPILAELVEHLTGGRGRFEIRNN